MEDFSKIKYLWHGGKLVPFMDAKIHVMTPTVFWASNVFEGMRGYWNGDEGQMYLFRIEDHFTRIGESSKMMRMPLPFERKKYADYVKETIIGNEFKEDVAIEQRIFVDGIGRWYETEPTNMFISAMPFGRAQDIDNGVASKTSTWLRISDHSMSPRIKCGSNYQNSRLAILEAAADGYKTVLFINDRGKLSEGPGYCIFLVRRGAVVTPSVTSDILESITRFTLIDLFQKEMGLKVEDREVDRTEVYVAEEAFFCGTRMEIVPITSLDRILIGNGTPGPITKRIQQLYFDIVRGKNKRYFHWLTPVY